VSLRLSISVAVAVALVAGLAGCSATTPLRVQTAWPSSTGAIEASSSEVPTDTPDTVPQATSPQVKALDPSGVGVELDAMEKELDQLDMPSDSDFSDAEGALY
jgi:uncharacterized lipoprotein